LLDRIVRKLEVRNRVRKNVIRKLYIVDMKLVVRTIIVVRKLLFHRKCY
jgi:hypothetical protein